MKKQYMDLDDLRKYDALLEDYINQKIATAIDEYRQEDESNDNIIDDQIDDDDEFIEF